ncbi:hypothetical protein JCM31598_02670 [Desulfonatronum parangueonense]
MFSYSVLWREMVSPETVVALFFCFLCLFAIAGLRDPALTLAKNVKILSCRGWKFCSDRVVMVVGGCVIFYPKCDTRGMGKN